MNITKPSIETSQIYSDFSQLNRLKSAARADQHDSANNKAVTQQFESLYLNMMLKSMREANAAFEDENGMTSSHVKFYQGMLDQQMAVIMSERGGIGLSGLLEKQLQPKTQASKTSSIHNEVTLNEITNNEITNNEITISTDKQLPFFSTEKVGRYLDENDPEHIAQNVSDIDLPDALQNRPAGWANSAFSGPSDFITTLWPFAIEASRELGVSPKILVAQAALETGWGRHFPRGESSSSHNLFGIKSSQQWSGDSAREITNEFKDGRFIKMQSDFRIYKNYQQSFSDYVEFLKTNPRYQAAIDAPDSDESFIRGIHQAGYATDPEYAEKILSLLNSPAFKYANT